MNQNRRHHGYNNSGDLGHLEAVVLCGGLGTRLKPVLPDRPKILTPIGNRIFLDILLDKLGSAGIKKIILCVGFMSEKIIDHVRKNQTGLNIKYSVEKTPLGTGGALKHAEKLISGKTFLTMNGDTVCRFNYKRFLGFHLRKRSLATILSAKQDSGSGGRLVLAKNKSISRFIEKPSGINDNGYVSAGIYLFQKSIFRFMPKGKIFSLERDFFPKLAGKDFYAFPVKNNFLDFGTPENFTIAQKQAAELT